MILNTQGLSCTSSCNAPWRCVLLHGSHFTAPQLNNVRTSALRPLRVAKILLVNS